MKPLDAKFAPQAETDVEGIQDFLNDQYPGRDVRFTADLRKRVEQIATFPEMGRPLGSDPSIRVLLVWDFLVIYRVEMAAIQIERVLHGARDIEALLE